MDKIREQLLESMGFSVKAISILDKNLNIYSIPNTSITEKHQGSCNDVLFLSLKKEDEINQDAAFDYIGNAGLQVCASALTVMIKGLKFCEAIKIDVKDFINYLEGIPRQKYECAEISKDTLRNAFDRWNKNHMH